MKRNDEYKQIHLDFDIAADKLAGKVVDKVAFQDKGSHDTQFLIVTFTDKTYIAVGVGYKDFYDNDESLQIENFCADEPSCIDDGCFDCHTYIDDNGNLHFSEWIKILKDFKLWDISEDECKEIIERKRKKDEEREYQQYLRLKEKYEKDESC